MQFFFRHRYNYYLKTPTSVVVVRRKAIKKAWNVDSRYF